VYDAIPYNTCIMQEKGVITSVNSDSPELGRRLNQEAAKSVMYCGMSQEDALKLVTINPAIQLRIDKYVGSLTVGKDADFVVWNGNPLSVYSHPLQTWIDGRLFFDIDRDATEREKITQERSDLIQKVLTSSDEDGKPATKQFSRPDQVWHCEDVVDIWQTGHREKGDNHEAR